MRGLRILAQKIHYRLLPLRYPGYALGRDWCKLAWKLDFEGYQRKLLERLKELIESFRRVGLCNTSQFDESERISSFEDLKSLPVLERSGMQALLNRLRTIHTDSEGVYEQRTGGSTGEPVQFLQSRSTDHAHRGAKDEMTRLLGWRPGMFRHCLWGSDRDIGMEQESLRGIRKLITTTRMYGGFRPSEDEYLNFFNSVKCSPRCAVYGFSALLEECARLALDRGESISEGIVETAWVGGETLLDRQREIFRQAFGQSLRNHYGSREFSSIASECRYGTLHVNPRYIVETREIGDLNETSDKEVGSLLITDLFNPITPFIRYQIGDLGSAGIADCKCERGGQMISNLAGRIAHLVELASGRKISPLFFNHLFKDYPEVKQFQVVRTGVAGFEIRYRGEELSRESYDRVIGLTSSIMDGSEVRIILVDELVLSETGKLIQYFEET